MMIRRFLPFILATLISASAALGQISVSSYSITGPNLRTDPDSDPWEAEGAVGNTLSFSVQLFNAGVSPEEGFFEFVWANPGIGDPDNYQGVAKVQLASATISINAGESATFNAGQLYIPRFGDYIFEVRQDDVVIETITIRALETERTGELTWGQIVTPVLNTRASVTMPIEFSAEVFPIELRRITSVNYYVNGILVNTGGPVQAGGDGYFPFTWDQPWVGDHSLYAIAQLNNGHHIRTPNRNFSVVPVGSPPAMSISAAPGDNWVVGSNARFSVQASDSGGLIERLVFIVNGREIEVETNPVFNAPWTFDFRFPSTGPYEIYAMAEFSTGNRAITNVLRPVVGIGDIPVVTLISPVQGMRVLPGTEISIMASAWDRNSLIRQLHYFVNDTLIAVSERNVDGSFSIDPNLYSFRFPFAGDYRIYVQGTDESGFITQSDIVTVHVSNLDPTLPRVMMTHPLPVGGGDAINDVSVGSDFYMNAQATVGGGARIQQVRFFINGQLVGSTNTPYQNTYAHYFAPTTAGDYVMIAEAVTNQGKRMHSAPLILEVFPLEMNLPEIEMVPLAEQFREVDVGTEITVQAETWSGLVGVDQVNFFLNGVFLGSADSQDADTGYFTTSFIVREPGTHLLSARAIQIDPGGLPTDNWVISNSIPIRVNPGSDNRVFVTRTYEDFTGLILPQSERDTQVDALNSGQKTRAQYVWELMNRQDFINTQHALMTRKLLTDAWPNRTVLRRDLNTIASGGVEALVQLLMPQFQTNLWDGRRIPDAFSTDRERNEFFRILFERKYGQAPRSDQLQRGSLLLNLYGAESLIAEFIRDTDAVIFGSGRVSAVLGIPNPPNDRMLDLGNSAAILINLLHAAPSSDEVESKLGQTLIQQIEAVLDDPRYHNR